MKTQTKFELLGYASACLAVAKLGGWLPLLSWAWVFAPALLPLAGFATMALVLFLLAGRKSFAGTKRFTL